MSYEDGDFNNDVIDDRIQVEVSYASLGMAKFDSLNPALQDTGFIRYQLGYVAGGYRYRVNKETSINFKIGAASLHATSDFIPTKNETFEMFGVSGRWAFGKEEQAVIVEYEQYEDIQFLSVGLVQYF
ncbi:MAG: hypothetical protein HWE27_12195 [Gammaproteobacteria bacterium]|nr:hypothetical protein [Gammaproteobacteria bacterium]